MNRTRRHAIYAAWTTLAAFSVLAGCSKAPWVNPWVDDSLPPKTWYTPSARGFAAYDAEPVIRQREIAPTVVAYQPSVPHWPLYFEDPFEDQGDNNHQFAWGWQDYLHMPYGLGRFILNTIGTPVSVFVTPPLQTQVSDGVVNKEEHPHDALPGDSPDPVAERSDFGNPGSHSEPLEIVEVTRTAPAP